MWLGFGRIGEANAKGLSNVVKALASCRTSYHLVATWFLFQRILPGPAMAFSDFAEHSRAEFR